ncbi:MAG: GAF domain-containing protein [Candidatus Promineofilum sp.]|nr:GAF domain-containing protein [Promineifilum sp.]MBP9656888.1 GAF domain-containing protein [Promineifilum sp.]
MIDVAESQLSRGLFALWQGVLDDLRDVFDLHYVCASFSSHAAKHLSSRALVALADGDGHFYNLWISEPNGSIVQEHWSASDAGFGDLLIGDQPMFLDKLERPASEVISSRLWLLTHRKLFVIPITGGDRTYSPHPPTLLVFIDPPNSVFSDLPMLEQIGSLFHIFLDRAALRESSDRHAVEFAVISDINQALSATLNVQEIYQLLTGPIRQTLNVETLSIGLVEPVTGDITFVENLMGPMFERLPPVRLSRGQGIAGWVADHKEPVTINNTYLDKRFFSEVDRSSGFRTRSMICIPLTVDDRTIGVLQAINRLSGEFTEHDLQLIQAMGGPLAAAIENANLHRELLAESQRIETLLEQIDVSSVTINRDGIISRANSAFNVLLGEVSDNSVGCSLNERLLTRRGELDSLVSQVFNSTGDLLLAAELVRPDGRVVPVVVSGSAIGTEAGDANEAILTLSDVTQIREVERMRDDLFQGIIHELRTPLATILMYSRLLRGGKATQPDKAERFLGVIERESDRLQRMIRQMLDLAKLDAREIRRGSEAVELNPIITEVLPSFAERAVHKGLLFRQRIAPDLPLVSGSAEVIVLTLRNLLDNAIKFSPSGNILVSVKSETNAVVIDISDEGIGIPPESLPYLFKRFYRTQVSIERGLAGTGLGLYMVKESLKNYNGEISVQSKLGERSVFTVRLPIAQI